MTHIQTSASMVKTTTIVGKMTTIGTAAILDGRNRNSKSKEDKMENTNTITTTNNIDTITMEDIMNTSTIYTLDDMNTREAASWGWEPAPAHAVIDWDLIDTEWTELWASWEDALVSVREVVDAFCWDPWIAWDRRESIAVAVTAQAVAEVRGTDEEPTWWQLRPEFAADDDALDRLIEAAIVAGEEE